jgi:hypothetical protein
MSGYVNPGAHPDADSLGAFLEGVLPEHERLECLAHFAQCPRCREVVFLAQEPAPALPAPNPIPAWRRWLTPVAVLSGAAACLAIALSFYPRHAAIAPAPQEVASTRPKLQAPLLLPATVEARPAKIKPAAHKNPASAAITPPGAPSGPLPLPRISSTMARLSPSAPTPPRPQSANVLNRPALDSDSAAAAPRASARLVPAGLGMLPAPPSAPLSAGPLRLSIQHDGNPIDGLSEIAGSVTDPTGAAITGATVTLNQVSGAPSGNARVDQNGKFTLSALPAGKYELRIAAPGFQTASGQIELQAQDVATVAPVLSVGSAAETVEVTASASAALQTAPLPQNSNSELMVAGSTRFGFPLNAPSAMPPDAHSLPSKLPIVTTAASGKILLSADSAGALFYSDNAGKSWKAVKSNWHGNVTRLTALSESAPSGDVFQLTTQFGSVWLSRDGLHWRQATPQR